MREDRLRDRSESHLAGFYVEFTMLFSLQNERTIETTYTNNSQSMLGYVYKTAFWTARKLEDVKEG